MRIAIVGAGPAGLYLARLIKRARPNLDVKVFEQNPEGATWGFGVGLGGRTRQQIEAADPDVHDRITAAMLFSSRQRIHLDGAERTIDYADSLGAIERLRLLEIILSAARESGVEVSYDTRIETPGDLADFDLIVAADGANSVIRGFFAERFGTSTSYLTNHFAWYGVAKALEPSALVFRTIAGGRLIGHYYAYRDDMSTFVAECDDATWHDAGLDRMSDLERRKLFETAFAPELEGEPLVENRSIWRQFPVVTNQAWFVDNVVLVGDALHSAHFSIGSGTRLAMEDAIALFSALDENEFDLAAALPDYARRRSPGRSAFGEAARRSFTWYEDVADHMRQPLDDFIHDFLTRTGRIDDERLKSYAPGFYEVWRRGRDPADAQQDAC